MWEPLPGWSEWPARCCRAGRGGGQGGGQVARQQVRAHAVRHRRRRRAAGPPSPTAGCIAQHGRAVARPARGPACAPGGGPGEHQALHNAGKGDVDACADGGSTGVGGGAGAPQLYRQPSAGRRGNLPAASLRRAAHPPQQCRTRRRRRAGVPASPPTPGSASAAGSPASPAPPPPLGTAQSRSRHSPGARGPGSTHLAMGGVGGGYVGGGVGCGGGGKGGGKGGGMHAQPRARASSPWAGGQAGGRAAAATAVRTCPGGKRVRRVCGRAQRLRYSLGVASLVPARCEREGAGVM